MTSTEGTNTESDLMTYYSDSASNIGTLPPMFPKVILALVIAFGVIGNGIIIKVFLTSKQLRTPSNLFIVNLAIGDLTFLLISITTLYNVIQDGHMLFGKRNCTIIAFVIVTCASESLMTMGLIAISRYVAIVHPQKKHLLSWKVCIVLCVFTWLYGSILITPSITSFGRLGYGKAEWACTFDWTVNLTYNIFLFISTQGTTSAIMCFCYANIIRVFRQSKRRVAGQNSAAQGPKKEEIRLAIQLLVVFGIYNVCWGPYFLVVVIIDSQGEFPSWVYGMINIFVFSNFAVNILVYLYYNKAFRAHCLRSIGVQKEAVTSITVS